MRAAALAITPCLLSLLTSCAQAPVASADPNWAMELARVDPMFGGGDSLVARLRVSRGLRIDTDAEDWKAFAAEALVSEDARAAVLVTNELNAEAANAALAFLRGEAGEALLLAEATAFVGYPQQPDSFPDDGAEVFGDPERVGDAARADIGRARAALAEGGSVSPWQLSLVMGAAVLTPAQAREVAAFSASEAGRRWHAARRAVWPGTRTRLAALGDEAKRRGLATGMEEELPDLVLPIGR